jgi:hypothetical protein
VANEIERLTQDIVAAPLGDVIAAVGEGVARAQQALDEASIAQTMAIYSEEGDDTAQFLREIGYRPTFYALPETTGEVTVSLTLGGQANRTSAPVAPAAVSGARSMSLRKARPRLYATPVDGGYANKYDVQGTVSAKLTFRIVPVPAPDGLDDVRVVPNLVDKSLGAAQDIAARFELETSTDSTEAESNPSSDAKVVAQDPAAGDVVLAGQTIVLTIEEG